MLGFITCRFRILKCVPVLILFLGGGVGGGGSLKGEVLNLSNFFQHFSQSQGVDSHSHLVNDEVFNYAESTQSKL
jgi:hypothetical protein